MPLEYYSLGKVQVGAKINISLFGGSAKIRLMSESNFRFFRNHKVYDYYGGSFVDCSIALEVPFPDFWHLVIEGDTLFPSLVHMAGRHDLERQTSLRPLPHEKALLRAGPVTTPPVMPTTSPPPLETEEVFFPPPIAAQSSQAGVKQSL